MWTVRLGPFIEHFRLRPIVSIRSAVCPPKPDDDRFPFVIFFSRKVEKLDYNVPVNHSFAFQ